MHVNHRIAPASYQVFYRAINGSKRSAAAHRLMLHLGRAALTSATPLSVPAGPAFTIDV